MSHCPSTLRAGVRSRTWRPRSPSRTIRVRRQHVSVGPGRAAGSPASRRALPPSRPSQLPIWWGSHVLLDRICGSGGRLMGGLALLEAPDRVAERIANAHVRAVEVLGGLLREVRDAARLERFVEALGIVGDEHEAAQRSLGDELAELGRGGFVVERRARLFQRDLGALRARHADRQPAVITLADVIALLEP